MKAKKKEKNMQNFKSKITDLISSITKTSGDYHEKYWKTKFNPDNELPLNKTKENPTMTIVVRAIFLENNKFYLQIFLDKYLYKLLLFVFTVI